MSFHVVCRDGYCRGKPIEGSYDGGWFSEKAAKSMAEYWGDRPCASDCPGNGHRVERGIRLPCDPPEKGKSVLAEESDASR